MRSRPVGGSSVDRSFSFSLSLLSPFSPPPLHAAGQKENKNTNEPFPLFDHPLFGTKETIRDGSLSLSAFLFSLSSRPFCCLLFHTPASAMMKRELSRCVHRRRTETALKLEHVGFSIWNHSEQKTLFQRRTKIGCVGCFAMEPNS